MSSGRRILALPRRPFASQALGVSSREKARREGGPFESVCSQSYARGLAPRKIRPVVAMGSKPSIIVG